MEYRDQIDRIKVKLKLARKRDSNFELFGASSHKYKLGPPLCEEEVRAFEKKRNITLPSCYRAFITHLGNGGPGKYGGAGPNYGIYPLGTTEPSPDILPDYLSKAAIIYPDLPFEKWKEMKKRVDIDSSNVDELTDDEFIHEYSELFQGMMCIETQGCTYYTMLVVAGEYKGRIVHVDVSLGAPAFDKENNFLDWYEKWLNKVIYKKDELGFDFIINASEDELLDIFAFSREQHYKLACLQGLSNFSHLSRKALNILKESSFDSDNKVSETAINILEQFELPKVEKHNSSFSNIIKAVKKFFSMSPP